MRTMLFVVLVVAACGKKKEAAPEPGSASGSPSTGSGSSQPAATPPPATSPDAAVATGSGSGCTLPDPLPATYTLTKGCTLKTDGINVGPDATLVLEPGVKLQFAKDARLEVHGKLVAQGTADAPIVLTSADASPNPGDWVGVVFTPDTKAGSVLDHVKLEYAGADSGFGRGAVHLYSDLSPGRVAVTNSEIAHAASPGIVIDNDKTLPAKLEGNTFTDTSKTCIVAPPDVWGAIGVNKCGDQLAHVSGGSLTKTATWPKLDTAYVLDGSLEIEGTGDAPVLTLPEGATIKAAKAVNIHIGGNDGGGLVATKVTFTSAAVTPDSGDWNGIVFADKATKTVLDGCTVEYAGASGSFGAAPMIFQAATDKLASRVTVKNTTLAKTNANNGMSAPDDKCGPYADAASGNKADGAPLCKK